MKIRIYIILVTLSCYVFGYRAYNCKRKSALLLVKQPAYEFSMRLLQKVAEDTDAHFVFSPLTTWLQIIALSEGAIGETFEEIWQLTNHHRSRCYRRKLRDIISRLHRALRFKSKRKSVIAIDKVMLVKTRFILELQKVYGIDVMLLDFNQPANSSLDVNRVIEEGTGGIIDTILYEDDFMTTVLILADANSFHSVWQTEFYHGSTQSRTFYSSSGNPIGAVNMMHQTGYYYMIEFPQIGVKVLEMPLGLPGISMLVLLPTTKMWIGDLFYNLENMELAIIFNLFKAEEQKLVNVAIPKFSQVTEIENLPELLFDMGIKRIFDYEVAELKGISEYTVYASVMTQITHIKVNEKGGSPGVEFMAINETGADFTANRPFAYLVIDKTIEFIIYAGVYSVPSNF